EIAFKLGSKLDPSVKKNFETTNKQISNLGKSMGKAIKTGAKWAAGIAAAGAAAGTAAFAATRKVTQGLDHISKTSQKMGVTTDFYQQMEYWANQNGISQDNMEKSMKRLTQRLGLAAGGNKKYSGALE